MCAVVVTRYFGGTLLGTGGLVRAYQKSVAGRACGNSVIIDKKDRTQTVEWELIIPDLENYSIWLHKDGLTTHRHRLYRKSGAASHGSI